MSYKVWKASITEYRVQNTITKEIVIAENLTLTNCRLKVSLKRFKQAKANSFQNSQDPMDYFAWIECEKVKVNKKNLLPNKVFYNPFKSGFFRNRETLKRVTTAKKMIINGNTLSYEQ